MTPLIPFHPVSPLFGRAATAGDEQDEGHDEAEEQPAAGLATAALQALAVIIFSGKTCRPMASGERPAAAPLSTLPPSPLPLLLPSPLSFALLCRLPALGLRPWRARRAPAGCTRAAPVPARAACNRWPRAGSARALISELPTTTTGSCSPGHHKGAQPGHRPARCPQAPPRTHSHHTHTPGQSRTHAPLSGLRVPHTRHTPTWQVVPICAHEMEAEIGGSEGPRRRWAGWDLTGGHSVMRRDYWVRRVRQPCPSLVGLVLVSAEVAKSKT